MITFEQAEKLTTQQLLAYYKKNGHNWETKIYTKPEPNINYVKVYTETEKYWQSIKELLDRREYVEI